MIVKGGSTDVTTYFNMRLLTTGAPATGLTISDFDMQYVRTRETETAKVDAVALAATNTAHTDSRGIEVDSTDQKGLYRFDWPDAAFAAGTEVILSITHASCFTEHLRVELVGYSPTDGVRLGLTALPNAAADAAGGLPISDAGGLDLDAKVGALTFTVANQVDANVKSNAGSAITAASGIQEVKVASIANNAITAASINDAAIDAATFAADVDAEILSYLVDDVTRIDASALNTASVTSIPAILVDTNELQTDWTNGGRLDLLIDATLADTNELQTDWVNGGRLDLILDARASQTSVDDLPTNAELATSQAAADDATLAAIAALTIPTAAQNATAVLTTQMTESYAADGAAPTLAQAAFLIQQMLTEFGIVSTTLTVNKLDGTTAAATFTLDSDTSPTSITRAT